jgi:hypothetical protein
MFILQQAIDHTFQHEYIYERYIQTKDLKCE